MNPKISLLVSARKDSKYLAKFILGLVSRTDYNNVEVKIIIPENDTWNKELLDFSQQTFDMDVLTESYNYGRAGLHVYFNDLAARTTGDWIIYLCDDHFIIKDGWDQYLLDFVKDLDPQKVWCLIPKFDNIGPVAHIVSRGFYNALGHLGQNGWIDSYLNDLNALIPQDRIIHIPEVMFHDFTHDVPNPMEEARIVHSPSGPKANFPPYDSDETRRMIAEDAQKLIQAIQEGK